MKNLFATAGFFALILFSSSAARAQTLFVAQEANPLELRHHEVAFTAGWASALGFAGFSYSYSPITPLIFEAGAGYGFTGTQLSLMPKVAIGSPRNRFIAGVGVSAGIDPSLGLTTWLNVDVGYQHRFRNGLSLTAVVGPTIGLSGLTPDVFCDEGPCANKVAGQVFPQGRVSLGYWF